MHQFYLKRNQIAQEYFQPFHLFCLFCLVNLIFEQRYNDASQGAYVKDKRIITNALRYGVFEFSNPPLQSSKGPEELAKSCVVLKLDKTLEETAELYKLNNHNHENM